MSADIPGTFPTEGSSPGKPLPLLSICIPTFNRAEKLDELVDSLASQIALGGVEVKVEIVISDNASSDATREVGEKWVSRYPFIRYFRNSWNIGGDPNQLRVIGHGRGTFAWILGDDDRVTKDALARILSHLGPGVSQLFLDYRCVGLDGEVLATQRLHPGVPDEVTTVDLIRHIGYVTVFSLISSHIFDREKLLAIDSKSLLKVSPWYILCMLLIVAFHDQRCVLVRNPVLDYTAGNDRLPDETTLYVRVIGLLNTLRALEKMGKIDETFLYGIYETGAGDPLTVAQPHYFREELYANLIEIKNYWALPGKSDARLIRDFVARGPGFWALRVPLQNFFLHDLDAYLKHKKPVIHYWRGKAWYPAFSLLLSSDDGGECEAFDHLAAKWPEEFAHESILISRLPEEDCYFENIDVFMEPYRPHRAPSASLNSGFRKALAPRVLVLDQVRSPAMLEVIKRIDDWDSKGDAPDSCLLFESAPTGGSGMPKGLLGLYLKREPFVMMGGFENRFENWPRHRLLADAGYRLGAQGWAADGGEVAKEAMQAWFETQLPGWLRFLRKFHPKPFIEHGLNISLRHHLLAVRADPWR